MLEHVSISLCTSADDNQLKNLFQLYLKNLYSQIGIISLTDDLPFHLDEGFDCKNYLTDPDRKAYWILLNNEKVGFSLLNQVTIDPISKWNVGEFFILPEFQKQGIGKRASHLIWSDNKGQWEIQVLSNHKIAIQFWRKSVSSFAPSSFKEEIKSLENERNGIVRKRLIFTFDVK